MDIVFCYQLLLSQVQNYLPVKTTDNTLTTPFYAAYNILQDYEKLLPLFSMAHVKVYGQDTRNTFFSQTIPFTLVGNDPHSDGRLFFNSLTRCYTAFTSGPTFQHPYDSNLRFHIYNSHDPTSTNSSFTINKRIHTKF